MGEVLDSFFLPLCIKKLMRTHRELLVWKKSIEFVTQIYNLTNKFPKDENYGLSSQLRRAAISIPSNIAEGAARNTDNEYVRFLYMARASASEIETQLIISKNLNYFNSGNENLDTDLLLILKMLTSLINKISQRIN